MASNWAMSVPEALSAFSVSICLTRRLRSLTASLVAELG